MAHAAGLQEAAPDLHEVRGQRLGRAADVPGIADSGEERLERGNGVLRHGCFPLRPLLTQLPDLIVAQLLIRVTGDRSNGSSMHPMKRMIAILILAGGGCSNVSV